MSEFDEFIPDIFKNYDPSSYKEPPMGKLWLVILDDIDDTDHNYAFLLGVFKSREGAKAFFKDYARRNGSRDLYIEEFHPEIEMDNPIPESAEKVWATYGPEGYVDLTMDPTQGEEEHEIKP